MIFSHAIFRMFFLTSVFLHSTFLYTYFFILSLLPVVPLNVFQYVLLANGRAEKQVIQLQGNVSFLWSETQPLFVNYVA
jgi:hypothetical protein